MILSSRSAGGGGRSFGVRAACCRFPSGKLACGKLSRQHEPQIILELFSASAAPSRQAGWGGCATGILPVRGHGQDGHGTTAGSKRPFGFADTNRRASASAHPALRGRRFPVKALDAAPVPGKTMIRTAMCTPKAVIELGRWRSRRCQMIGRTRWTADLVGERAWSSALNQLLSLR